MHTVVLGRKLAHLGMVSRREEAPICKHNRGCDSKLANCLNRTTEAWCPHVSLWKAVCMRWWHRSPFHLQRDSFDNSPRLWRKVTATDKQNVKCIICGKQLCQSNMWQFLSQKCRQIFYMIRYAQHSVEGGERSNRKGTSKKQAGTPRFRGSAGRRPQQSIQRGSATPQNRKAQSFHNKSIQKHEFTFIEKIELPFQGPNHLVLLGNFLGLQDPSAIPTSIGIAFVRRSGGNKHIDLKQLLLCPLSTVLVV